MTKSPDCRDGNHHKCDSRAWDEQEDHLTVCDCDCGCRERNGA